MPDVFGSMAGNVKTGDLTALDPSLRDKIAWFLANQAGNLGADEQQQRYVADKVGGVMDFIPGVGDVLGADDTARSFNEGNYGQAALNGAALAMGLIPGAGDLAAKGVKEVFGSMAPKAGRKAAITAESLRGLPLDKAIDIARSERHLIPKTGGGFVGAPYAATDRAAIEQLRAKFDADVAAGAEGSDWYERVQNWIKETAGPDPAAQSELARNLALFSAQADPDGNLGFSITARNNAIMGMQPEAVNEAGDPVVRTGQQWKTYLDAFNSGKPTKLGKKTGVYADHMDPTRTSPTTGTNDIWHARALGYMTPDGKPWESALTDQQHAFMDAETVLAVDRANQAGIGGRFDWTPGEIQAAPWVAGKGRGLAKKRKGMTVEQGIAEASKTYPDYAPKYTANATHEMTPGRETGHLPGIANAEQEVRDAFANEPGGWWQDPEGHDVLYRAQGAYTAPTNEAQGIYGDPVQFNPMQAGRPLVSFSGPAGERGVERAGRQLLTGTESFRAMMDAQDAGAWSIPIPGQKAGHNNAFKLALTGQSSPEELAGIRQTGEAQGMGDLVHYGGPNAAMTEFYPGKTGVGARQAKEMNQLLGARGTATPTHLASDMVGYGDEWRGGAPEGAAPIQGSDMVTNKMLANLTPAQEAALDKPEVRQKVLERFDRDARVALERGDVVRDDIQRARKLFAEGGFKALRENLTKGLLPVAAVGLFLNRGASDEEG